MHRTHFAFYLAKSGVLLGKADKSIFFLFLFFSFIPSSNHKPRGKGKTGSGQVYSSTNYRIPEKHERMLRHAGIFLEAIKEPICTAQQMVEDAVAKYIEFLRKKRNVPFPDYLSPDDKPDGDFPPAS